MTCTNCGIEFVIQPAIGEVCPACGWWKCGSCDEMTNQTHFRHGADGVMFHAGLDALPSDEVAASVVENFGTLMEDE